MNGIDKIKYLLPRLYGSLCSDKKWSDMDWCVNYKQDLNEELRRETANLQVWINILNEALQEKDLVAAMVSIVRVRVYLLSLYGFFHNIVEDVDRVNSIIPRLSDVVVASEVSSVFNSSDDFFSNGLNFNLMKKIMSSLIFLSDGERRFSMGGWGVGCVSSLDEIFSGDIRSLLINLDLAEKSMRTNDWVAVRYALERVQSSAQLLSDFFKRILDDIEKAAWPDDKPLADIPEDYEIPARYNHAGS
ncbi:hypothetical protein OII53_13785 [Achromobacter ruhlandii]|nr:hypothetical protein [Achromobacter ruhlandii]MCV6797747.1 hypothetical protein [Achromobacter ruhlandii]MCV6805418.1 hypothetical protein [Achromobacter ruhlandii]MCV6810437.1 hypothetical protein [Achromobacter ruhlandii]MCV6819608.1 hypothetical protein [Achromobacter ruhlandii]